MLIYFSPVSPEVASAASWRLVEGGAIHGVGGFGAFLMTVFGDRAFRTGMEAPVTTGPTVVFALAGGLGVGRRDGRAGSGA
jgi:hypothetical protein